MRLLVSIVIPTYNRCALLRSTVDSVLAQTYPNIEVIVVDDGSTDDTPAMLAGYGDRLTVLRQENRGGTAARNAGIAASRGAFVSVLDHDDLLLPEKVEKQIRLFERNPRLGLVHCRWYFIGPQGHRLDKIGPLPEGDVRQQLLLGCFLWSGGPLVRREILEKIGCFDEGVWSSDWDLWLRIALDGQLFGCAQQPLGSYRILRDSSMADISRTERLDARLLEKAFARPDLPAELAALKKPAFANWHFWLSRRYYSTGLWPEAKRNLSQAISLHPTLQEQRAAFLDTMVNEALDVRVNDPIGFIEGFLAHLPNGMDDMQTERENLLCRVRLGMALRDTAPPDFAGLRFSDLRTGDLRRAVVSAALRLPVEPLPFVNAVFAALPAAAAPLQRQRQRALAETHLGCAFESFYAARPSQTLRHLAAAIWRRPALARNRGARAILIKSLTRFFDPQK